MVHVVKSDLTHNLSQVNASLADAVSRTISEEISSCEEWTEINVSQKLLKVIAIVSGHVFLGPELYQREEYLHASIDFTMDLFIVIGALKRWPKPLRFVAKYAIPQIKKSERVSSAGARISTPSTPRKKSASGER